MGAPNGPNRTPCCGGISWRSCLSGTPPAAAQHRSKAPPANPAGAGWATSLPAPPAGWRKTRASWPRHPRRSPAARLRPGWWANRPQQEIGQVQQHQLFQIQLLHRSSSFRRLRSTTVFLSSSLNWASFSSTDGRSLRSAFLTFFWVYSENAAVRASASRAFKENQVLGRRGAAVLFHRIVHAVLAGDALKVLDGRVVDLDVGDALVLPDELLHGLLALGGDGGIPAALLFQLFSPLRWAMYLDMAALNSRPVNLVPLTTSVKVLFSTSSCIFLASLRRLCSGWS